jgi:hypothetical protein
MNVYQLSQCFQPSLAVPIPSVSGCFLHSPSHELDQFALVVWFVVIY